MKKFQQFATWFFSLLFLLAGFAGLVNDPVGAIFILLMGALMFPPLFDRVEKQYSSRYVIPRVAAVFVLLIGFGAVSEPRVESEQEAFLKGMEDFFVEQNKEQEEFRKQFEGKSPAEILDAMYEEVLAERGESKSNYSDPFSEYFATQLALDAKKMNAVQTWKGTRGVQSMIEVMNPDDPGVSESLTVISRHHELRTYNTRLFKDMNPEAIVQAFVDSYSTIYGPEVSLNSYKQKKADEIKALTDLDPNQIEKLVQHHSNLKSLFGLFPEDYPNLEELKTL